MGTGASKTSSASLTPSQKPRSNSHNYRTKSHSPTKGKGGSSADVVRVGLTKLGFSPGDVTLTEGQTVEINWNVASGTIAHNIRQVVFDGQTVYPVQGGYNSGSPTSAGTFTINFSLQGEFKFISDGYEANSNKVLVVTVKSRSVITAELTDDQFRPSVLHIHEGNSVKWTWNSCQRPHVINEIKLCPKHYGIVKTTGGTSVPMQSGSYKHEFLNPGLFYFQSEGSENGAMQLCIVHVKATQRHHYIEVTDRRFNPRLITITQGDRVWWLWDRFKCKKKHRILQVDIPTGQGVPDPFPRPVKGGFCSDAPSRAGMLSHIFHDAGVYYYCDNNYEDNREYLGVVIVKPRAKEHHIEVTAEGFYPDLSVISSGDRIWWSWDVDRIQESFSVMQVDSCVASDNKILPEVDCNNFCKHLTKEAAAMVTNIGMATVQLNTPGVYHYRVSDTANNVGCCSVIVNPGQKDHCIAVSDMGFEPKVLTIHPGDRVWWIWEDTKLQHNIIQVSHQGHPIKDGFCSGFPQDSPAAFVSQLSTGAVVYFQSAGLPKMYGAVVMVEQAQVHQVLVSKNHLQPDPVLAQMDDCVAWVWPVLRKHGLTQLTNTQQVFELQTYTQDIVTPRRCCALRFSNPGVYHYYSKAFSNKTDKFMYEHSSKTVLSSVVVSNPSGPITVMVSSKGFKPPTVNIQRGQSVLWSWKGSQSETHNIVHANPPTHERPYSPVQGPLGFSSGNPEPNNSYMFTFEEPGTFYETSEGAPGCVGVIHVLDDESLTSVPAITSSSNGGVVERAHTVELQSLSQTVTILYTLDGSIPELHGQATRVYKPDRRIILRRPGLLIIRAIGISAGALPSKVFTSKRFWVLEGNVGHSSEEDDSVSIATEDFEAELQNSGPGPTIKWQWWNCVPSISGWLHTASDSSIEIYWDLPSIPYRGQLKSYQLIVNGICYHNDLPPTCNSITVEGLLGNQTYTVSIIVQPKDSSLLPQESNRLKVTCPGMYELGGPILSCEITEQEDEINLVWTSMDEVLTDKAQYVVYIDGRENDGQVKTVGQYKKCRMILPHREVLQAPLTVFVLALTEGNSKESDGCLSNELQLALPLSLDNMYVPNGGNLIGKLYLIIKEGSGKPPDPKVELLPSVAPQESFDGSASTLTAPGTALTEDQHDPIIKRSLECEETFNKTGEEALSKPSSTAQTDTPTDSKSDSEKISLPKPVVSVRSQAINTELHIRWQIASSHLTPYVLHHYNVCVAGRQFDTSISSHSRQEMTTDSGETEIHHSWNAGRGHVFVLTGLSENSTYSVTVHATYHHKNATHQGHMKASSKPVICTTGGQPQAPKLLAKSVGLQEVTLSWTPGVCHEDIDVMGYQMIRNGKPLSEIIPYGKTEKLIKNLQPGTKQYFGLSMVTTNAGQTKASNLITVTCPDLPDPPVIRQERSMEERSAVVVWPRQKHKHISLYFVYIDGKLQGEIKAKSSKKQHNHRYILHNLRDNGRQYNVSVKAYAGWMAVKKDHPNEVTCGVMSEASNLLTVTYSSAPLPSTLNLNLECVHAEGADVAWVVPDLNEASLIRGFIILKDGQPHLSNILPPTTTRTTLSGLKPGSSVTVQVLAVTEMNSADEDNDGPSSQDASEVLRIHPPNLIFQSEALNVKYDQLVQAPSRIWCELVRCHSVMVVWDKGKKPRKHYKAAEEYVVTWWELSKKTGEPPQRKLTSDDHLLIDGLDLGTKYCITVQAQGKHKQHHTADKKITGEVSPSNIVLVRSQTESTTVVTASPPQPPSHLDVTSVGATTVQLKWEAPVERGAEVIGLRVYVTMLSDDSVKTTHHTDLLPDVTSTIIKHLVESTTYTIHLVTITDEYFEEGSVSMVSPRSKLRSLPDDWNDVPVDCPWLPCVSVEMTTAGLAPPSGLSCIFGRDDAVTLLWRAPMIQLGVLKRYEVRWLEVRNTGAVVERSDPHETIEVVNEMTSCEIPGLVKGKMYSFMVVAVVSETEKRGQTSKKRDKKRRHHSKEALLRLESEMFVARVPAPCVAPDVMVTSYGSSWVDVYWEKPSLVTSSRNSDDPVCSTCLRRTLLAYKLEVNGAVYATLKPNTQQYTIQCTATQSYEIVLIAITTADKGLAKKASAKPHHMRLASAEYEGMFDESASKTVVVTLPRDQSGNIVQLGAKFHPSIERHNEESEENSDLQGDIHLKWALQDCGTAEEQGIVGYDATWFNDADDEERVATLPQTALSYDIPVYHNRCIYKMTIQANQHDDMWQDVPSPSIQCVIPGPPDPPNLCCTSVMQEEFILEWGEPRLYGGVTVRGYQVYMNDKKVGQELSASHYKAAIPCRPNRTYHMSIVALSADPNYRDSDLSDEVVITCWSPETQPIAQVAATSKRGQGDGCSHGSLCPEDISVGVLELSEMLVVLEWRLPLIGLESQQLVDRIKVLWSSVARPKELEAVLKPTATQYSIKGCIAGTNHFVSVVALDEGDRVIHRSRQLTVQTSAPLATPNLTIRSCTYSGCILEWEKPMQFGNAHLIGYQLRLNGKDHDKLPAGTSTYLFTAGKMCKEYTFTLKALCYIPHLHSKDSDPAIVTWPGVIPPALHRAATTKLNAIKVSWPEPKVTGGAKVQQYKVMCVEESGTGQKACPPDRRQPLKTLGPLSPDQRFAEFPNLSPHAAHTILLDTYVSGIGKAIRSRPMNKQYVARKPAPPSVRVAVRGLEERRALEMEACQLINMRHRVLQELFGYQQESSSSQPPGYIEHSDHAAEISDALSALAEMEEQLFQVLETLLPYTGTVSVDLEWDLIPDKKDVNLSGFKVLVNGKQHGFLLHSNIDRICLQLSAYDGLHKICLIAVTDHPVGNSDPSEVTVINTSPFLPFSCYCLHTTHRKDSRHPKAGCCNFQQTLAIEASPDATSILMSLHQPLVSSRHVPPASVSVMDVFDKAQHLLIPTKLTNRCPTMLLFWTRWCLASMKAMDHFVDYAKNRAGKVICVSCCCNSTEPSSESHIQSLSRQIMQRGWRDDGVIRHSCSCYSNDGGMMPGSTLGLAETQQGQGTEESKADQTEISSSSSAVSVPELFGVRATPMIIILHPEGYLAWQGCYAAYDKATFTSLMDDTLEAVIKTSRISSSSNSPKLLSRATSASSCTISSLPQRQLSPRHFSNVSSSRPPSSSTSSSSQPNGSIPRAKTARRRTLKKRISVEDGPYSGGSKGSGSAETNGRTKSSGKS
ncbi:uncharacterized protein [Asterias amurensis]|uniref:uncharacterized protein isoform X3 n=1 Tax=Asterias amurensis TaxID=7602 RepID=UPI003AB4C7BD